MDGRKNNGGHKTNGGRKSIAHELHTVEILKKALRAIYDRKTDEGAKIAFLKEFAQSQRGQQFIAEHLFGKPKDIVENINRNFEVRELTANEVKALRDDIKEDYGL